MLEGGQRLLEHLDAAGVSVVAAFWLFHSGANEWRLALAIPQVETEGPREIYSRVRKALDQFPQFSRFLALKNITLLSPQEDVVKSLRAALRTGPGIHGIRFSRNRIQDAFIEDAYIYRAE